MSKILFSQSTSSDGQIIVTLSSSDLPAGSFNFNLSFGYTGSSVLFNEATFSGSSSTSISSSSANGGGSVSIQGAIAPSGTAPFATLVFDAKGSGTFDA